MTVVDYTIMFQKLASDVSLDSYTISYCLKRLKSEGISFWMVTLPKLWNAVLRSLELGYFERPLGFQYMGRSLRYFRSLLVGIFNQRTGEVLENVDPKCIYALRQLCQFVYKLALPFDDTKALSYENAFIDTDKELGGLSIDEGYVNQLRKDLETYYPSISRQTVQGVFSLRRPRKGSGTFAGKQSYRLTQWYLRKELSIEYPAGYEAYKGFFKPYPSAPVRPKISPDVDYSEVLFVPKDSRGPRTIVREPFGRLSSQLAFHDWIKREIEISTQFRVNFVSQQVNRELARQSSMDKTFATIDLSSASDRVSYPIWQRISRNSPALRSFLSNRTKQAKLPSGRIVNLNKVAGMGSGLTFPLMSLLITLTITRSIVDSSRLTYSAARRLVYVYGDDIVIPTKYLDVAYKALRRVGLKINEDKSFSKSLFRESCGGDYYNGHDVAPVRLKLTSSDVRIADKKNLIQLRSNRYAHELVVHAKECVQKGLFATAEFFYSTVEQRYGKLPQISGESPVLGRWSYDPPTLQVDETGAYREVSVLVAIPVASDEEEKRNPYVFLGSRFRDKIVAAVDFMEQGLVSESAYNEVSIPRQVKIRRTKVSSIVLLG